MTASSLTHQLWRSIDRSHVSIALALSFVLAGCAEEPTRHTADVPEVDQVSGSPSLAAASSMSLSLPFTGTANSNGPAFKIVQQGIGHNAIFEHTGTSGSALLASTRGVSNTFLAQNHGTGGRAAWILSQHALNTAVALEVGSSSLGAFTSGATGLLVNANNSKATFPAVTLNTLGTGPVLKVNHKGSTGDLAIFQTANANKIRFSRTGRGYFNGGTQLGGADVAEAFEVEGKVGAYQPGDVLAISERSDRTVEKSTEPYSTRVIGVYATKPGVLLTERDIETSLDDMVPVGVIGVIPTKVSAENGPIRRGDLLVTAETPGHAMRGTERDRMLGAVIGKALAGFSGPGTRTIPVLVNVK
jgi:hypothetical protein